MFWGKDIKLSLRSFSKNHLDFDVENEVGEVMWRLMGIYQELDSSKRDEFWLLLRNLCNQSDKPWLCWGDFNELLWNHEKK